MINKTVKTCYGFTLAEALATLAIAAMVMASVATIYSRMRRAESSIKARLDKGFLEMEVLQRVAEDIDRTAMPGADITLTVKNRTVTAGYGVAQMVIESRIYDADNQSQVFERIVWQGKKDPDANGVIIYRSHSGFTVEDKMLDEPKEEYELGLFVPMCRGVTFFGVDVFEGTQDEDGQDILQDSWEKASLPAALRVSVSFAEPVEDLLGNMEVAVEDIKYRTVALDRVRQMNYQFVRREFSEVNSPAGEYDVQEEPDVDSEPNESDIIKTYDFEKL